MQTTWKSYKEYVGHPSEFDPRKYLRPGGTAIKDLVTHKIKIVLGCSNKR